MMKKVLIVTYYWPPSGGGGVQRWLKFVKYLPEMGWQPIVFTPENADYPIYDDTLQRDVHASVEVVRHPIWEPYRALRQWSKSDQTISAGFIRKEKKESLTSKAIQWVRGNLIIPDARRFWIRPASRHLIDYLRSHPVDAIVSTGPPHSMHLIARRVSRATGIPWLADFRDPWLNMDNADKFQMSAWARAIHARLEKKVLREAHEVVTVGWQWALSYEKIRGKAVSVITNGFDHTDFQHPEERELQTFTVGHYGTFGDDRNPTALWTAISELMAEDADFAREFRLELLGPTDIDVLEAVKASNFSHKLTYEAYVKHDEAVKCMQRASVLLVPINQNNNQEGRIAGKIFEYLAANNRILGIGSPTSDCARIIREADAGEMFSFADKDGIKAFLKKAFSDRYNGKRSGNITQYTRQNLSRLMADVLDRMTHLKKRE